MVSHLTVSVDRNERGGWEVTLPGQCDGVTLEMLDEAQRVAYCAPRADIRASWSYAMPATGFCIASSSTAQTVRSARDLCLGSPPPGSHVKSARESLTGQLASTRERPIDSTDRSF